MEVTREEYGDIYVTKPDGEMTVAELVEALSHMPQDAIVRRYAEEWTIYQVHFDPPDNAVDLN